MPEKEPATRETASAATVRCIAATTGTPAHGRLEANAARRGAAAGRLKTSSDDANGLFADAARSVEPGSAHCSNAGIVASVAVQSTRMQPGWSAPARHRREEVGRALSDGRAATRRAAT